MHVETSLMLKVSKLIALVAQKFVSDVAYEALQVPQLIKTTNNYFSNMKTSEFIFIDNSFGSTVR